MGKEAQNKKVDNNKERVDTEQILEVQMDKREQLDETSHKERLINNNMAEIEIQSATLQDKGDDVTMQDKGDDVTIQGDGNEANPTIDQTTLHYNEASESIDNNDSEYLYEQTTVKDLLSQKLNAVKSVEDNMEQTIGQFNKEKSCLKEKDLIYYEEMMVRYLIELDTILTDGNTEIRTARKKVVSSINRELEIIESQKQVFKTNNK